MFLLPCPYCGERPQIEFSFHGDATVQRPSDAAAVSLDAWLDHIYLRDNPRGAHCEWWLHSAGCRRWIKIHRDTFNHRVLAAPDAADA